MPPRNTPESDVDVGSIFRFTDVSTIEVEEIPVWDLFRCH